MIEILLPLGSVVCLCLVVIIAFMFLGHAEGTVNLQQEAGKLLRLLKGEDSSDTLESGMIQGMYPGARVTTSTNAAQAPPTNGFLLIQDSKGDIVNIKGSGTIKS